MRRHFYRCYGTKPPMKVRQRVLKYKADLDRAKGTISVLTMQIADLQDQLEKQKEYNKEIVKLHNERVQLFYRERDRAELAEREVDNLNAAIRNLEEQLQSVRESEEYWRGEVLKNECVGEVAEMEWYELKEGEGWAEKRFNELRSLVCQLQEHVDTEGAKNAALRYLVDSVQGSVTSIEERLDELTELAHSILDGISDE